MTHAPSDRAPVTQADRERAGLFLSPSDGDFEDLAALFRDHRIAALEAAAEACRQQEQNFLSPEYATGQPISSIQERFACRECAAAILSLKGQSDDR